MLLLVDIPSRHEQSRWEWNTMSTRWIFWGMAGFFFGVMGVVCLYLASWNAYHIDKQSRGRSPRDLLVQAGRDAEYRGKGAYRYMVQQESVSQYYKVWYLQWNSFNSDCICLGEITRLTNVLINKVLRVMLIVYELVCVLYGRSKSNIFHYSFLCYLTPHLIITQPYDGSL